MGSVRTRRREFSALLDVLLAVATYDLVARWHLGSLAGAGGLYRNLLPVVALIWWVLSLWVRRDLPYRLGGLVAEIRETIVLNAVGGLLLFALLLMTHELSVSRLVIGGFPVLSAVASVAVRVLTREYLAWRRRRGHDVRHLLVIGPAERCQELAQMFLRFSAGLHLVGLLLPGDQVAPASAGAMPVLGTYPDLPDVLHGRVVDQVAIATPVADPAFRPLVEGALREGKTVLWSPDAFAARLFGKAPAPMILLSEEPDALGLAGKRVFDLVAAVVALIALSPLLGACALAVKLDDPGGPVLFRQRRVGLHGREFTCLKFRTMVRDAEARRAELARLNEMDGPVFKMREDPRVTRVGRVLRKYSLDEFPQLWNVLLGQMSLVGPRPPLPAEVAQYQPEFRRRLAFRPGLTCLWQVSGRNNLDFQRWMELDLHYVDNWSLWLDLRILLRTIPAVLFGSGV